jgi:DNA-binding LacI/PurR family transcriptional regulator
MKRKPVSLADLAERLGTTPATVSRALRNEPRISVAMRGKVARLAAELGYRPDPETTRLMARIRARREAKPLSALALLVDTESTHDEVADPYTRRLIAGARQRGVELGYSLDPICLREPGLSQERLDRILYARAITGVLIPPQSDLPHNIVLPAENVALVAATAARSHLHLHRVFPDHFQNFRLIFDRVAAAGHSRIGLITTPDMEERQRNAPLAAYEWFVRTRTGFPRILPFVAGISRQSLRCWFEKHRPSVMVGPDDWVLEEIRDIWGGPSETAVVLYGNRRPGFAGIDELPEVVGAAALDLLSAHVIRGEYGYPTHTKNVTITGEFRSGASFPE